ncbi:restriction endonuclease subunit S [Mycobacterium sp. SMC-18]|uniref:restriction endonuclease subunit S n=1 Tax=Mycobacteriaceae TaxID=1762 RepID=UPI00299CEDA9|nr:restriction endonuclease subunit S [Mycolicibacterium sp. 141076]MDX1879252.1 restriction endonuclease subunit S [Mycolicibacterium sp. 141076]
MTQSPPRADRWSTVRLAYLFEPRTETDRSDLDVLSVYRDFGVILKSSRDDNFNRTPADLSRYQVVHPGDLVVNRMKAWQGSLGVSAYHGLVSPDYEVLRPTAPGLDPRFVHHLLRSRRMISEYAVRSTGIRPSQWRLYWAQMRMITVPIPDLPEQKAIADFIDRETARIDTLIEEQQRLIDLLRERRQSVLSGASDIAGRTARLGLVLNGIKDGTHGTFVRTAPGEGRPLLGARNVTDGCIVLDGQESFISDVDADAITSNGYPTRGDVALVIVGATIGKTALYEADVSHAFQRSVAFLRPAAELDPRFLWYQIQSDRFQDELSLRSKTSAQPGIYLSDVSAIPVVVPSLDEQHRIVAYLDEQTSKIDTLIAETERFIELARERRSAVITAAVTAQIDVRAEVA